MSKAKSRARAPVVDLANDENDDWLKKAYPQHRTEDLAIHDKLRQKGDRPAEIEPPGR